MGIKDFFTFNANTSSSTFQASAINLMDDEEGINDRDRLIAGRHENITIPVVFKQVYGKKLLNMLGTGWPGLYLISDKMKLVLEENKLTGWKTFPIKLYDKKENEILGYHGFSVTGRCGPIDYKKAEIVDRQMIPTGPICKRYKGLFIGLDKWDGSDFFIPEKSLFLIITNKTANTLKKNKDLNTEITNCADFEMPTFATLDKN